MGNPETSKVRKRGAIVLPARIRKRFGLEEGTLVVVEETPEGVLIRPAMAVPLEVYTPQRTAEFILSNAVNESDYAAAVEEVRSMGLVPESIPHEKPPTT